MVIKNNNNEYIKKIIKKNSYILVEQLSLTLDIIYKRLVDKKWIWRNFNKISEA